MADSEVAAGVGLLAAPTESVHTRNFRGAADATTSFALLSREGDYPHHTGKAHPSDADAGEIVVRVKALCAANPGAGAAVLVAALVAANVGLLFAAYNAFVLCLSPILVAQTVVACVGEEVANELWQPLVTRYSGYETVMEAINGQSLMLLNTPEQRFQSFVRVTLTADLSNFAPNNKKAVTKAIEAWAGPLPRASKFSVQKEIEALGVAGGPASAERVAFLITRGVFT